MIHGEISIYLLARLRRKYLAQLWKIVYRLLHNAHNDQKFQREQKKSSPIFKCKTIISDHSKKQGIT